MTSVSNPMITRCPKCGTAFRVTQSQLQSAKGSVRCGSCLNVFKAQQYAVPGATITSTQNAPSTATDITTPTSGAQPPAAASDAKANPTPKVTQTAHTGSAEKIAAPKPSTPATIPKPAPVTKTVTPAISKSSLEQTDDILISDDMEDTKSESKSYDFDGFMDINMAPKSEVSLFERKLRSKDVDMTAGSTDESWAEMLIDDEDDTPQLAVVKLKTDEQHANDALAKSHAINTAQENTTAATQAITATPMPGLIFSLVGEQEEQTNQQRSLSATDDFKISAELERIPSNQGFNSSRTTDAPIANALETPDDTTEQSNSPKRQLKTQPKIRAYDGSRTSLLMNIIPAPIEFNAKRMRRWYQRKLWPSLSILALITLAVQVGWFKFDYFSRVEPYRTGYLFLCPHLGCQVPTLVDTSHILASNLVVREHPDTQGALAVDVMLINGAPFEQPFPDLLLVFTDIDQNQVASRRFIPKDYLGGELVGRELMPQNQKIHVTLDLVDPGAEAVNYHISIPRN